MRPIGFSTGALALSDFARALEMLRDAPVSAVELSALRAGELPTLVARVDTLDLSRYRFVSVHAPSRFAGDEEPGIVEQLRGFTARGWPVVLHPDAIHDAARWRPFGPLLLVENMDKRKPLGRTAAELRRVFDQLPEAALCFDIAHARQCDGTMTEAYRILTAFGDRLRQVHVSEVTTRSGHDRISPYSLRAFQQVASLIPDDIPIIIESRIPPEGIRAEIDQALLALTPPAVAARASA
ncbi:MAG TPA: hypothetical protein VFR81_10235 [Longimicrobium sp.]|nr:hypothetical protein [Longimicrobium sp.]